MKSEASMSYNLLAKNKLCVYVVRFIQKKSGINPN